MKRFVAVIQQASLWLAMVGCAGNVPPARVIGTHADLITLGGTWEGDYEVTDGTIRRGTIYLELAAERDTARGYVLMSVMQARNGHIAKPEGMPSPAMPYSETLSIKFVRVTGNVITGVLDPYRDPVCGCVLTTTFSGQLRADEITGQFRVRHSDGLLREAGNWRASRKNRN